MRLPNRRLGGMAQRSPARWALPALLTAWALSLGPGCGWWDWSPQPLVLITEDGCQGSLALVEWGDGGPNLVLARELRENDCIEGIDRDRWHHLYLWCEAAGTVDATSGLINTVKAGEAGVPFRERCERIVVATDS